MRFHAKMDKSSRLRYSISKKIIDIAIKNTNFSSTYSTQYGGGYFYKVHFDLNKKVSVNLLNMKCICREQYRIGMSCIHAMRNILTSHEEHPY